MEWSTAITRMEFGSLLRALPLLSFPAPTLQRPWQLWLCLASLQQRGGKAWPSFFLIQYQIFVGLVRQALFIGHSK